MLSKAEITHERLLEGEPIQSQHALDEHYVLCPCVHCRTYMRVDSLRSRQWLSMRSGPCAHHGLALCVCDRPVQR